MPPKNKNSKGGGGGKKELTKKEQAAKLQEEKEFAEEVARDRKAQREKDEKIQREKKEKAEREMAQRFPGKEVFKPPQPLGGSEDAQEKIIEMMKNHHRAMMKLNTSVGNCDVNGDTDDIFEVDASGVLTCNGVHVSEIDDRAWGVEGLPESVRRALGTLEDNIAVKDETK